MSQVLRRRSDFVQTTFQGAGEHADQILHSARHQQDCVRLELRYAHNQVNLVQQTRNPRFLHHSPIDRNSHKLARVEVHKGAALAPHRVGDAGGLKCFVRAAKDTAGIPDQRLAALPPHDAHQRGNEVWMCVYRLLGPRAFHEVDLEENSATAEKQRGFEVCERRENRLERLAIIAAAHDGNGFLHGFPHDALTNGRHSGGDGTTLNLPPEFIITADEQPDNSIREIDMRAVVQRVSDASVQVQGKTVARIGQGLLVLVGVARDDTEDDALYLAGKVADLRVFSDSDGKMNRSVKETSGRVLVVSQFTLLADCRKGRRPSFDAAAVPDAAEKLYMRFVEELRKSGLEVQTGEFRAMMDVCAVNAGPVTILLDSHKLF